MTNCDRPDLPSESPAPEGLAPEVIKGAESERENTEKAPAKDLGKALEKAAAVPEGEGTAGQVALDPALLAELREVTDEPARAVDTAVRQWLQRRAIKESDTSRPLPVNPFVPPRGEWND